MCETEQSIKADCYDWIAECINTQHGYSVQEHVECLKVVLQQCSEYFHDFPPSTEGGNDECFALARNIRHALNCQLEKIE